MLLNYQLKSNCVTAINLNKTNQIEKMTYSCAVSFIQRTTLFDLMQNHVNLLAQNGHWIATYER